VTSTRAASGLNEQQRVAVEHVTGPLLLLAGAGTGKTRVVTVRIGHIVASGLGRADEILALTFTNKAAREMRERAETIEPRLAGRAQLSTFHSTCARWLRQWGREVGLTSDFTIYDDDDQKSLLKAVLGRLNLPDDASTLRQYASRIESAKNEALRPIDFQTRARGAIEERIGDVFAAYNDALIEANACDFADLVSHVVHILEQNDTLRGAVRSRWRHVMVDEFQDTNGAQYRLLQQLVAPDGNVMVVGDDDQSIYRWRGATVENVRRFEADYSARVLALEENYRSTQSILNAAHAVVERLPNRFDKRLRTSRTDTEPVYFHIAADDRRESEFVARVISELRRERRLDWRDFAVFYRTNAQSRLLEEQLRARSIPYQLVGGLSFFERREVRDVLGWVRVAVNPADDIAFRRIANTPPRGIGKGTLDTMERLRREWGLPHLRAALTRMAASPPPRTTRDTKEGLASLDRKLFELERVAPGASASELLAAVLEISEYENWLFEAEPDEADDRMRNIGELLSSARSFVPPEGESSTLAPFLEHVALREAQSNGTDDGNGVTLMTVHAAKGLEFPVVFATGLEDGVFPLQRRGVPLDDDESAEERRLWYVAVTRARDVLYVTAAQRRALYGNVTAQKPSQFLLELERQHVSPAADSARIAEWSRGSAPLEGRVPSRFRETWDEYDQRPEVSRRNIEVPEHGVIFDDSYFPETSAATAKKYVGKRARHATFGVGFVIGAEPTGDKVRLTINFPGLGTKKVVARFVEIFD
jgi:DNA helicase-2/ATP-dependent DNA helicase PcrA